VLLNYDSEVNLADTQKKILKDLSKFAHQHFKTKYWGYRLLADVVLALSGVGLIVLVGRKISGRSFFFSNADTKRQNNFCEAILGTRRSKTGSS
jgi:hypothetical protein